MTVDSYIRLGAAIYKAHQKRAVAGVVRFWRGPNYMWLPEY